MPAATEPFPTWKVVVGGAVAAGAAYFLYSALTEDEPALEPPPAAASTSTTETLPPQSQAASRHAETKSNDAPAIPADDGAGADAVVADADEDVGASAGAGADADAGADAGADADADAGAVVAGAGADVGAVVPGAGAGASVNAALSHPCPACRECEDLDGSITGLCSACGLLVCGKCMPEFHNIFNNACPSCNAPIAVSPAVQFKRLSKLVKGKPTLRHTTLAYYNLANAYYYGHGCTQDYPESVKWHTLAANRGSVPSQHDLGIAYDLGHGVEQDHAEAVTWWTKAAEAGYANSQVNLFIAYSMGKGVGKDPVRAIEYCTDAAKLGSAVAQFNLGVAHLKGEGVQQDMMQSIKWLKAAAGQGDTDAKRLLNETVEPAIRQDADAGNQQAVDALRLIACSVFIPGAKVEVFGLTSAGGKAMNGKRGVVGAGSTSKGRVPVLLAGTQTGKPKAIKEANLKLIY